MSWELMQSLDRRAAWPRIGWRCFCWRWLLTPAAIARAGQPATAYDPLPPSVGGISINADGLLDNASVDALGKLAKLRARPLAARCPADLKRPRGTAQGLAPRPGSGHRRVR